jgi:hypothetical protein
MGLRYLNMQPLKDMKTNLIYQGCDHGFALSLPPYYHYAEVFVTRPMMDTVYWMDPRERWSSASLYGMVANLKN